MSIQTTFKPGDLVTGSRYPINETYSGYLICPVTVMHVDKVHDVTPDEEDPWRNDPDWQSNLSSVGHHQHVICNGRTISGALVERVTS